MSCLCSKVSNGPHLIQNKCQSLRHILQSPMWSGLSVAHLGTPLYYFSLLSPYSSYTGILLFLKTAKHTPTSSPLHMLFTLLEFLFSQVFTWLIPSLPSSLSYNVTTSKRSSQTFTESITIPLMLSPYFALFFLIAFITICYLSQVVFILHLSSQLVWRLHKEGMTSTLDSMPWFS